MKLLKKMEKDDLKSAVSNVKEIIHTVFVEDINKQAKLLDTFFGDIESLGKTISKYAEKKINKKSSIDKNIKFQYSQESDVYYFNEKEYEHFSNFLWGFSCYIKGNKLGTIKNKIYSLATLKPLMETVVKSHHDIAGVFISLPNLYLIYSRTSKNFSNDFKHKLGYSFSRFKSINKPLWSKAYYGVYGNLKVNYLHPIFNTEKKSLGFAGINIPFDQLTEKLDQELSHEIYSKYSIARMILDKEGNIISLPKNARELISLFDYAPSQDIKYGELSNIYEELKDDPKLLNFVKTALDSNKGELVVTIGDKEYMASFRKLPVNNWSIIILAEYDILYKQVRKIEQEYDSIYEDLYANCTLYFLFILLISFLLSVFFFKKLFISPIQSLKKNVVQIGNGNFDLQIKEKSLLSEVSELTKVFNKLGSQLKTYIKNLKEEIKNRETIQTELKIAGNLQQSVLPKITQEFNNNNFELHSKLIPAKEMSGDFYDFFSLNDRKKVIVVADVAGKGISAAFYMSMAKAIIKATCFKYKNESINIIAKEINNELCSVTDAVMFLTLYLVIYDIFTGKFVYLNAGNQGFIKISKNNEISIIGDDTPNFVIGYSEDYEYQANSGTLEIGESLLLFTDGIIEAFNSNKTIYGSNNLYKIIKSIDLDTKTITDSIVQDVINYQNNNIADDITILVFKRKK